MSMNARMAERIHFDNLIKINICASAVRPFGGIASVFVFVGHAWHNMEIYENEI